MTRSLRFVIVIQKPTIVHTLWSRIMNNNVPTVNNVCVTKRRAVTRTRTEGENKNTPRADPPCTPGIEEGPSVTRRPVVVYAVLLIFIYFLPFRRTRPFNPFADVRHHACGPTRGDVISFVLTRSATGATRFRARKTQNNGFSFIVFRFFTPFPGCRSVNP